MYKKNYFYFDEEELSYRDYKDEDIDSKKNLKINEELQTNNNINEENKKNYENILFNKRNIVLSTYTKESPSPNKITKKIFKQVKKIPKESIIQKYEEKNEKYFPFSPGIGLEKCLKDLGYLLVDFSPSEVKLFSLNKENINKIKFQIMDFSSTQKGKLKKEKKQRKFKPDDLRKKIKIRFHKSLKNVINGHLKKGGSKKLFDFFPQYFVRNINIKLNNIVFNYTFDELIRKDIATEILKKEKTDTDLEKYNRNLDVLDYLSKNSEICNNSLFNKIRNMKYVDLLNAYFISKEFEDAIIELNQKGEKMEYIEEYINKSLSYVYFFKNTASKENNYSIEINSDSNKSFFE